MFTIHMYLIYMYKDLALDNLQRWLVGWFLWHINLCRLFNTKSILMQIVSSIQTVLIQTIQFSITMQFYLTHR